MLKEMDKVVKWIEKGFVDRFDDGTRKWASNKRCTSNAFSIELCM